MFFNETSSQSIKIPDDYRKRAKHFCPCKCGNVEMRPFPQPLTIKARGEKPFPFRGKGLGWGLRGI